MYANRVVWLPIPGTILKLNFQCTDGTLKSRIPLCITRYDDHRVYDAAFRLYHEATRGRGEKMADWDLTSVGLVLIGSSITVAGMIIAALLMGVTIVMAPFLIVTAIVLVVMSAVLIIYKTPRSPPPI